MAFEFPDLPYDYSALEPSIDAQTMEIHYDRHHRTYFKNFTGRGRRHPARRQASLDEVMRSVDAGTSGRGAQQRRRLLESHPLLELACATAAAPRPMRLSKAAIDSDVRLGRRA